MVELVYKYGLLSAKNLDIMLTEQQVEEFQRDGYLVYRGLFDAHEIADLTRWTDEVMAYPEQPGKYMKYFEESCLTGERILSRVEDIEPYHGQFSRVFNSEKLKGVCTRLFGTESVLYKDKINFKLPGGAGFKAHQDVQAGWGYLCRATYHDPGQHRCLQYRERLHGNGPGQAYPGIDRREVEAPGRRRLDYAPIPTEPGDTIFFDSFAPHRSKDNLTNNPRRVLYVTYNRLSEGDHRRQ